jgi:hypothetical protein
MRTFARHATRDSSTGQASLAPFLTLIDQTERERRRRRRLERKRWFGSGESLPSAILGTLSVALAGLALAVTILGLVGSEVERWSEQRLVMVPAIPPRSEPEWDWDLGREVMRPVLVPLTAVFVPTPECHVLAFFGEALGVAGLLVGWTRRRFSWSSAFGTACAILNALILVVCSGVLCLR